MSDYGSSSTEGYTDRPSETPATGGSPDGGATGVVDEYPMTAQADWTGTPEGYEDYYTPVSDGTRAPDYAGNITTDYDPTNPDATAEAYAEVDEPPVRAAAEDAAEYADYGATDDDEPAATDSTDATGDGNTREATDSTTDADDEATDTAAQDDPPFVEKDTFTPPRRGRFTSLVESLLDAVDAAKAELAEEQLRGKRPEDGASFEDEATRPRTEAAADKAAEQPKPAEEKPLAAADQPDDTKVAADKPETKPEEKPPLPAAADDPNVSATRVTDDKAAESTTITEGTGPEAAVTAVARSAAELADVTPGTVEYIEPPASPYGRSAEVLAAADLPSGEVAVPGSPEAAAVEDARRAVQASVEMVDPVIPTAASVPGSMERPAEVVATAAADLAQQAAADVAPSYEDTDTQGAIAAQQQQQVIGAQAVNTPGVYTPAPPPGYPMGAPDSPYNQGPQTVGGQGYAGADFGAQPQGMAAPAAAHEGTGGLGQPREESGFGVGMRGRGPVGAGITAMVGAVATPFSMMRSRVNKANIHKDPTTGKFMIPVTRNGRTKIIPVGGRSRWIATIVARASSAWN